MIFDDQTNKLTDTAPYLLKSHKSENPHPASENADRAERPGEQAVCGVPLGAGPPSPVWTSKLLSAGLNLCTCSFCSTTTCHRRLLRGLFLKKKESCPKWLFAHPVNFSSFQMETHVHNYYLKGLHLKHIL